MPDPDTDGGGIAARGGWFKTTHWTVVLNAQQGEASEVNDALVGLCQSYWYPLYSYVRRLGYGHEDAQDSTQEFFARLLEKHWLSQADPNRGRFRCFLLAAFKHFLANERRRAQAARRGGGKVFVSLDDTAQDRYSSEPASDLTPEKMFERRWALDLFERALKRLRAQYENSGKAAVFQTLQEFLSTEPAEGDYGRAGVQLGMNNSAVSVAVHRLRQRYRELVRDEIAHTVTSEAQVEEELSSLLAALG